MKYTQPQLPYANDALEPVISRRTVDFHYGKHEKTYIDNLNALLEGTEFEELPLEEIIRDSKGAMFNNASQAWNHIFYFFSFSPDGGGEPEGDLRQAIDKQFGWVWLSRDNDGKLFITQESNAGNPITQGLTPILTFDVWEHAYYLDYQNRRKDALERLWDIIDWPIVEGRY